MTRDVLYQSGWDQCTGGNSHPGQTCFWWVDDNRNNVPDVYSGAGHGMTSSSAIVINIEVIDKGVKIEKEKENNKKY